MGIKNLMTLVKKYAPGAVYTTSANSFKQQKIAIDVSIWAHHRFRTIIPGYVRENEISTNDELYSVDWVNFRKKWFLSLLQLGTDLVKYEIDPIFVFDGQAKEMKKDEQKKREQVRVNTEERYTKTKNEYLENLGNFEKNDLKEKLRMRFINKLRFPYSYLDELYEFLKSVGFHVMKCHEETDILIASLFKEDKITAVHSTDSDMLCYGVRYFLTEFRFGMFNLVDQERVKELLSLNQKEFVDLCILLGNDYNDGLYGYGIVKSLNFIQTKRILELLPSSIDSSSLKRTQLRKRFSEIPKSQDLIATETESSFTLENFVKGGFETFQRFALTDRWEHFKTKIET